MILQSLFTKWPKNYQTKIKKQYNNNILLNIMLSAKNITIPFLKKLFQFASSPSLFEHQFSKKILVNAFFEPSTRTSLSFETAMYKLGGNVITFQKDLNPPLSILFMSAAILATWFPSLDWIWWCFPFLSTKTT